MVWTTAVVASAHSAPEDVSAALSSLVATHGYKRVELVAEQLWGKAKVSGTDKGGASVVAKALQMVALQKSHGFDY